MNSSIEFQFKQDLHFILFMSIWAVGILIGLFCLLVIILSKPKLIPLEFHILMIFSFTTIEFKIVTEVMIISLYISPEMVSYCLISILNLTCLAAGFHSLLTLFYYSLFQTSNVSRSRLFVIVHELVHKRKTFIIYQVIVFFLSNSLFALYLFLAYRDLNECPNVFVIINKFLYNGLIPQFVISSTIPILVYISTANFIFYSSHRFISADFMTNRNEQAKLRKNLYILLKFLSLASIFVFSTWILNVFYFLAFKAPNSIGFLISGYSSMISYSLMPLFLISIHSITKKTLDIFLHRIYRFFKFKK